MESLQCLHESQSIQLEQTNLNELIYCYPITLPWSFYKDFIIDKLGKKLVKYVEKQFEGQEPEERFIEAYTITYPNSMLCFYGELFLIDINLPDNKYLPINFSMINTSSIYAL
jgi:hypothetical protein